MKNNIKLILLHLTIECHWYFVRICKKRLNRLYHRGYELSSPKMVGIGSQVSHHSVRINCLANQYCSLCEIK